MNDIEKAIDNLNFIKHNDFNDNIKQYKRIGVNSIDLAISALEKQQYFRNCKDCGCLEGNCNYDRCTKFDIGVNPELDGCTFYEDWGEVE